MPSWLERVIEHEELVEADFQRFYHLDYRDVYRPGGGASRLSLRRALSLARNLPPESLFKSEIDDRFPVSVEAAQLYRLEEVWTREPSPMWDARRRQRDAMEHKRALRGALPRARAHNAAFLARRRKKKNVK